MPPKQKEIHRWVTRERFGENEMLPQIWGKMIFLSLLMFLCFCLDRLEYFHNVEEVRCKMRERGYGIFQAIEEHVRTSFDYV